MNERTNGRLIEKQNYKYVGRAIGKLVNDELKMMSKETALDKVQVLSQNSPGVND